MLRKMYNPHPTIYRLNAQPWKKGKARQMRKNPTPAEKELWKRLRGKQLGVRFRHQHIILGFIADFYCPSKKLVIELDGEIHEQTKEYDWHRDTCFKSLGLKTLRFQNDVVLSDVTWVLSEIKKVGDLDAPL